MSPAVVEYTAELEHDGRVYTVTVKNLEILRCGACHAQVLPDAAHAALMEELRRQAGLLPPAEIAAKREQLGLNQKDFAHLLGVAPATVARWETGAQIQQRVMNDLMNAFFNVPELQAYLRRLRGSNVPGEASPPQVAATNTEVWTVG